MESLETRYAPAGFALQLDGVNDYATANDSDSLDLGTLPARDFTIEASFYVPALPVGNQTLVHKQDAYSLSFDGRETTFRIWTPTTSSHFIAVQAPVSPGIGWHHIAAVFDNENSPDRDLLSLYLDGKREGSTFGIQGIHGINNSAADLFIGASVGSVPIAGQFFTGWIDDVRFSNSVKYSDDFIVPPSPLSADPETAALWYFDEDPNSHSPIGPFFADATLNRNTLRGVNGATTGLPPSADFSFIVNSDADWQDISPGDGRALDAFGRTTLRAAIMEANASAGRSTIHVPAGIYTLTAAGQDETGAFGDLDIANTVTIVGDGADSTIISSNVSDRVFQVLPNAAAKLTKLTIRNGSSANGGGIQNQGSLELDNINLSNNIATWGGAFYNEGTATIVNSSLVSNYSSYIGGAIYSHGSSLSILNSTIGENESGSIGGGLVTEEGGIVTLTNATVYANRAPTAGGIAELNSSIKLKNSIVAGNQAGNNPDLFGTNYTSLGNNLIGNPSDTPGFRDGINGDQVGTSAFPLDPRLGSAGMYGGSTIVYPILPNSPVIDRGNNAGAPAMDQAGRIRVVDGDDNGTEIIDIGAVEYQFSTFVVDSFSDLPDVTPGDGIAEDSAGNTTLRAAIMEANALPGRYTIRVPGGIYRIAIEGQEETGAFGDLDIANTVTIVGDGADSTIISSNVSDRVFQVLPNAVAKLTKLTIRNGSSANGGGIYNQGSLELDNINLSSNFASRGGAIYNEGEASIANSSLVSNHATQIGGAIYSYHSNLTILNSTIGENEAGGGGGGLVTEEGGIVTLTNATVYANRAPTAGGIAELNSSIKLKNSIVAGNQAGNNPDLFGTNYTSLGNNLIGNPSDTPGFRDGINGDQVGTSAFPLDPRLGSAGMYGGSTIVYPILPNSPVIDRGNNAEAPAIDQAGRIRVVDGDDNGTEIIDIGAVEYQFSTFVVDSFSDLPDASPGDGIAEDSAGNTTLRAAIMEANALPGRYTIRVPGGIYRIAIEGQEETGAFGDLDIANTVTIVGDGADSTIISSNVSDRVFQVLPNAAAKLTKLTIRNGSSARGGGIQNQGSLELDNINLSNNIATWGGAFYNEGTATIVNSSLVSNYSSYIGGAIYSHGSNLSILNSTIGENESGSIGGGLVTEEGGIVTLTNATVYANRAPTAGGMAELNSSIKLRNSIVAGNQAGNNPDLFGTNYTSRGNNLIGNPSDTPGFRDGTNGDQVGTSAFPLDPHLGSVGLYGGSTLVYPVLPNSPVIDRGKNAGVPATDQLGKNRIEDGDDDGRFIVDIGAVEYEPLTFVVDSLNDFPDVLPGDGVAEDIAGNTTLRAAIMEANSARTNVRVQVPAGQYLLAVAGHDDAGAYGDLDLVNTVTIMGDGADTTTIESVVFDRIFHVLPGAVARISKLAIRNGNAINGGGILNQGTLALENANLSGNSADWGGAIYNESTASIANSSLMNNRAYSMGGAIDSHSSDLTILNSTIGANEANLIGGGLVTREGGVVTLVNATIHANIAPTAGGVAEINSSIRLNNSIVAGNWALSNPDMYGSNYTSLGNNLIGNSSAIPAFTNGTNGDHVGVDPRLGSASLNGGSTVVYPLLSNSPAIDKGKNVGASGTDQSGNPRIEDGDGDGSSIVDIGAVEYQPPTFVVDSFSDFPDFLLGDGVAEDVEGRTTLRAAIMEANYALTNVRIRVPAGLYSLDRPGQEDTDAYGDLDIAKTLTIIGDGADSTIIESSVFDRIFHILPGAVAGISKLSIRSGNAINGGGILNQGTLSLENANLTDNTAYWGGAIYNEGVASVANSSIRNNFVYSVGGAIYNHSANLTILNSTIGENEAGIDGGGGGLVTQDGGSVTVINSTVYANRAPTAGGIAALDSSIQLKNSIVAGNHAGSNPDLYGANYTSLGNNLIGNPSDISAFIHGINGDQVGSSFTPLDPRLGPADWKDGSTVVYPLLSSSPAIDRGNNAGAPETDQSGNPRIDDGDDDGSSVVDIGAVEYQPPTFFVNSFSDYPDASPGDGIAADFAGNTTLRAAIMEANSAQTNVRIRVPSGLYSLNRGGQEDTGAYGDLDISKTLTIIGDGADSTIIESIALDRIFHILPSAVAKISKLTIGNGNALSGGGIRNEGSLVLEHAHLAGNIADWGGAIYNEGTASIANSSIMNNRAHSVAGAIYSHSSNLTILNSTIGANEAGSGGGGLVTQDGGIVTVINSTVYANRASTAGGLAELNSSIQLKNSIVAGNQAGNNPDLYGSNYTSLGNNLIGNPSDVIVFIHGIDGDLVGVDPHLGPADFNGGSTVVYPLLPSSPAIDRGNNSGASATDQSGNPRIDDGDDDGSFIVDIGAVEYQLSNHRPRAEFNAAGQTLYLDLKVADTSVLVVSAGTSYQLTLVAGIWSGTNSASVTGNGTSTLTVTTTGLLAFDTINISDSAAGTTVVFNDSGANAYTDNFSVVLDSALAGAIQFIGTTAFTGANSLNAWTTSGIYLSIGSRIAMENGNLKLTTNLLEAFSATVTSLSGAITFNADATSLNGTTAVQTASIVQIAPRTAGTAINLGGNDAVGTLGLADAELDRIHANKLVIGAKNSGSTTVSAAVSLNTTLVLNSGSGGIVSSGGSLGTTGDSITLNTPGAIGASNNRLLFADQIDTAKQKVFIGAGSPPSSVHLGGLGSLTLGGIAGGNRNTTIDVNAVTHLTVAEGSTINSGTSRVNLGADLTMAGVGDDGVGKLTIDSGASVFGADITLAGADVVIDSTANVGSAVAGNRLIATLDGLRGPYALAFDDSGNLFVGNNRFDGTTVSKFAPGATTPTDTLIGLSRPFDLAFDGSGNLYVANSEDEYVSKFAPGTTRASAELTGVDAPTSLAFDDNGNLYVASFGRGSGRFVHRFTPGATSPDSDKLEGLNAPFALAFDADGNLFVVNYYGGSVSKFASGSTTATDLLTGLEFPVAIALDENGNVFAANFDRSTVSMFAPGAATPTATLEGLDHPTALAFDGSGNLFVANYYANTVSKFAPGATRPSETFYGLDVPVGFAFDGSGNLFVANYGTIGSGTTVSKFATSVAATSSVAISTSVANRSIDLGTNSPNTLGLTDSELDRITSGSLRIGDSNSDRVTFSSPLTLTGTNTLLVASGEEITQSFVGTALAGGASLVLQGSLSPALAGTGNFVVSGNTALDAATAFKVNLNGPSAYDQLVVSGNSRTINLEGAALALALDKAPNGGDVYKIIDSTDAGSSISGTFKYGGVTLNDGATFIVGNTRFRINYNPIGGAGDVILTATMSSYNDVVLIDSPNAYWRLGESAGAQAIDSSANGLHGSYENNVIYGVQGAVAGDSNTAIRFGGTNARVRVADNAALRPSSFSLEALVNVQGAEIWDSVIAKTSAGWNDGYGIYYYPSNSGELRFFVNGYTNYVAAPIRSNQFVHVAATYDGSAMKLYYDGVQVASKSYDAAIAHSNQPLYVGWAPDAASYSFNGVLDEPAIYGTALSAAQISKHAQAVNAVDVTPPTTLSFTRRNPTTATTTADSLIFLATFSEPVNSVDVSDFALSTASTASVTGVAQVGTTNTYEVTVGGGNLATFTGTVGLNLSATNNIKDLAGLALPSTEPATDEVYTVSNLTTYASVVHADLPAGYWQLNEASGSIATDSSANGLHGTYENSVGYGYPGAFSAIANTAIQFGSPNSRVAIADDVLLRPSTISLEAFVNVQGATTWDTVLAKTSAGWNDGYGIYYHQDNGGELRFFVNNYTNFVSAPISSNKYVHVVATYDGSTMRLYYDGIPVGAPKAFNLAMNHSMQPVEIGWAPNVSSYSFDGRIDEVAIYGRALTPTQVQSHYDASSSYDDLILAESPNGYWRLGESSGAVATDSSVNGHHGVYESSVGYGIPGAIGGDPSTAIQFGASNARVRIADNASLRPSSISLEGLVNVQGAEIWDSVLAKTSAGWNNGYGVFYHPANGGELRFFVNHFTNFVAAPISSNKYVHFAATYDGSAMNLYIDGVQVASKPFNAAIVHSNEPLYLGWAPGSANYSFNGALDEIAIYGKGLSSAAIQLHYSRSTAQRFGFSGAITNLNDVDAYRIALVAPGSLDVSLATSAGLNGAVRLFNISGNQVGSSLFADSGSGLQRLTFNGLSSGVYYVAISSQGNVTYVWPRTNGTGGTSTGAYQVRITPMAPVTLDDLTSNVDGVFGLELDDLFDGWL